MQRITVNDTSIILTSTLFIWVQAQPFNYVGSSVVFQKEKNSSILRLITPILNAIKGGFKAFNTRELLTALLFVGFFLGSTEATAQQSFSKQVFSQEGSALHFNLKNMPTYQLTDKIGMRFLTSSQFTVIQWGLKAGARLLPPHSHLNEQVTRVLLKGKVEVQTRNDKYVIEPDDVVIFPPYVPHGFVALTDAVMYEQQTPIRQDFLEEGFIEKLSEYLRKNQ